MVELENTGTGTVGEVSSWSAPFQATGHSIDRNEYVCRARQRYRSGALRL